jgi:hypothetical protein
LLAVAGMMAPAVLTFFSSNATLRLRIVEMQHVALWAGPAAGFAACLLGGWWVARGADAAHERNGVALGSTVALIDLVLLLASGAPFGALLVLSLAARLVGGYCGGLLAKRAAAIVRSPPAHGTIGPVVE